MESSSSPAPEPRRPSTVSGPPPASAVDTSASLLNFDAFGTPRRRLNDRAAFLKHLKEDLVLYRALDTELDRKQDRRFFRRPQTFSLGQAERETKLSAAATAKAVMDGEIEFDLHGGPRGMMKALGAATSTPFVPACEKDKDKDREALAASLNQSQNPSGVREPTTAADGGSGDENARRKSAATSGAAAAAAVGDPTAHIISEVELRQVRKQFKDLVRKQREVEAKAQSEMYMDVRRTMSAEKQPHHSVEDEDELLEPGASLSSSARRKKPGAVKKKETTRTVRGTPGYLRPKSARASSARGHAGAAVAEEEQHDDDNGEHDASTKNNGKNKSSTSISRATTSLAELAHASTSGGAAKEPKFFAVDPPKTPGEKQRASRARVLQFNSYRSNGVMGMQRPVTASGSPRRNVRTGMVAAAAAAAAGGTGGGAQEDRQEEDDDDTLSQDSNERRRRRDIAAQYTPRGGVSKHPSLPPDTAAKMFRRSHQIDVELDARQEAIAQEAKEASVSARRTAAAISSSSDPVIEATDPFQFLVDGAQTIHAGSHNQSAGAKREYSLSLQEKLLSLAASHAGVSLNAAAAPQRVLGVRPPTSDMHDAHRRSEQQRAATASARGRNSSRKNNNAASSLDDSVVTGASEDEFPLPSSFAASGRGGSKRVVSGVTNLNSTLGASSSSNSARGEKQPQVSARTHANTKQEKKFCNSAPLPFGHAGPIEKHIPAAVIKPPNNERQQRSLCDNVHASSRTPSCQSYRPQPVQFSKPSWQTVRTVRAAAHAGLAAQVQTWND